MTMKKKKVEERAYDYLKGQIESGAIGENTKIVEADIAKTLMISRSPVRGALTRLDKEGYLKLEPYKGAIVQSPSMSKVTYVEELQLFELLLIQYLFQVEAKGYSLNIDLLKKELKQLENALALKQVAVGMTHQLNFLKELLGAQKNEYYKNLLVKILKDLLEADFPELIEMRENSNLFYFHMTNVLDYLARQEFPRARRDIRILVNSLTLAVIDQQEVGSVNKYEM